MLFTVANADLLSRVDTQTSHGWQTDCGVYLDPINRAATIGVAGKNKGELVDFLRAAEAVVKYTAVVVKKIRRLYKSLTILYLNTKPESGRMTIELEAVKIPQSNTLADPITHFRALNFHG